MEAYEDDNGSFGVHNQLETSFSLPDAGSVYGSGAVVRPDEVSSWSRAGSWSKVKKRKMRCKKGKKRKRGRCVVKRKRKRR
jgi:hypothetical protein